MERRQTLWDGRRCNHSLFVTATCFVWWVLLVCPLASSQNVSADSILINCGGSGFIDKQGRAWIADKFFTGGQTVAIPSSFNGTLELFKSARYWQDTYSTDYLYQVPISSPGIYWVRLYFSLEVFKGATDGSFGVSIDGVDVLLNFSSASFINPLYEFSVPAEGPNITVAFTSLIGYPYLCGLEIVPARSSTQYRGTTSSPVLLWNVLRFNVGGSLVIDSQGRRWFADSPEVWTNQNSTAVTSSGPMAGSNASPDFVPAAIYESNRKISAANLTTVGLLTAVTSGSLLTARSRDYFLVRLHFAEIEGATVGKRLLDIYLNDEVVLSGLDVAGVVGQNTALHLDFNAQVYPEQDYVYVAIKPNKLSKIQVPFLSGIEVFKHIPISQKVASSPDGSIRINCGGTQYVDEQGIVWLADRFYNGTGKAVAVTNGTILEILSNRLGAMKIPVISSYRQWDDGGQNSYIIPLSGPGLYLVRLFHTEFEFANNTARYFSISLNGEVVITQYNGAVTDWTFIEFSVPVYASSLTITFTPSVGSPYISGIEVIPTPDDNLRLSLPHTPCILSCLFRWNVGGDTFFDVLGRQWVADATDQYHDSTGNFSATTSVLSVPQSVQIYKTDASPDYVPAVVLRSQRLEYPTAANSVPYINMGVPLGSPPVFVLVRLHFAELQYSNASDRVMDIYLNNKPVLSGLDVAAEVGPNTTLYKDFMLDASQVPTGGILYIAVVASTAGRNLVPMLSGVEVYKIASMNVYPAPVKGTIRINCGSSVPFNAFGNRTFSADHSYIGGTSVTYNATVRNRLVENNVQSYPLFLSERQWKADEIGEYRFSLAPGSYFVRLIYPDVEFAGSTERSFSILFNNLLISANSSNSGLELTYQLQTDQLNITFVPLKKSSHISAIEIIPVDDSLYQTSISGPLTLYNILTLNAGGPTTHDQLGRTFEKDSAATTYSVLPNNTVETVTAPITISNTSIAPDFLPPDLFQTARIGYNTVNSSLPGFISISFTLGSSINFWLFRLHFAAILGETPGDRVLDISVNNKTFVSAVDVAAEAGPASAFHKDVLYQSNQLEPVVNLIVSPHSSSRLQDPILSGVEAFSVLSAPTLQGSPKGTVRINCGGGEHLDAYGNVWLADTYFKNGTAVLPSVSDLGQLAAANNGDLELYGSYRTWYNRSGEYVIPLKPGAYLVTLYFTEMELSNSSLRSFALSLNGFIALTQSSGLIQYSVSTYECALQVTFSNLTISLVPYSYWPFISAIKIIPIDDDQYRGALNTDAVISNYKRFNIGGLAYSDYLGRDWLQDNSTAFVGTETESVTTQYPIAGTGIRYDFLPSPVYQSARKTISPAKGVPGSPLSVAVDVSGFANSYLLLRLHFAELEHSDGGDRIIDVYVNNKLVVSGLDVVAEVGPRSAYFKDVVYQTRESMAALVFDIHANASSKYPEPFLNGLEVFLTNPTGIYPDTVNGTVRINCGGSPYADPLNKYWSADKYYSGGEAVAVDASYEKFLVNSGTTEYPLLTAYRRWPAGQNNSYEIPLPTAPGLFWVRLIFAEFEYASVAQRTFEVYLDGFLVLDNFRIVSIGLGYYYEFLMPIQGPNLTITFARQVGDPFIAGIEVVPSVDGQYGQSITSRNILRKAYRYNCGGMSLVDVEGRTWEADYPLNYTNLNSSTANIVHECKGHNLTAQNLPMALYQSERKVDSMYVDENGLTGSFPVVQGSNFLVRLHLAEFHYEEVGDRVMNIYINDELVYEALDIIQVAGHDASINKDFNVVKPENSFFIKISIRPHNTSKIKEPKLNGLEILTVLPGPSISSGSSGLSGGLVAAIVIPSAAFLLALLALAGFILQRQMRRNRKLMWEDIANGPGGQELMMRLNQRMVQIISLKEIRKATDNFSDANRLGSGGSGSVYVGEFNGEKVAVKRITEKSESSLQEFVYEVELISQLNHINLLHLIGFCTEKGEQIFVMEHMAQGTLQAHIFPHSDPASDRAETPFPFEQRLSIAVGAARGLNYLHSFAKEPIIHRDIKTENILLDEAFHAKLADFGLLKRLDNDEERQSSEKIVGTRGYLDPEYYTTFNVTTKSDVYSFGVVLLELVTAKPPVLADPEHPGNTTSLVSWVKLKVNNGEWEQLPDATMTFESSNADFVEKFRATVELALWCVEQLSADRPNMNEVQLQLEEIWAGELNIDIGKLEPATSMATQSLLSSAATSATESRLSEISTAGHAISRPDTSAGQYFMSEVVPR